MFNSGGGKSTFVTSLSMRNYGAHVSGKVFMNGKEMKGHMKKLIGFVPQEDIMLSYLTVFETILFSGFYRSFKFIQETIQTIQDLKLDEKIGMTIGDDKKQVLSGGQKKRVNIGIETVNSNPVLILDEPTSGLVSTLNCFTFFNILIRIPKMQK